MNQVCVKSMNNVLFQNLDFLMKKDENWAIVSASSIEKNSFLDTIMGKSVVFSGSLSFDFADNYRQQSLQKSQVNSYRDLVAFVSQKYTFTNKDNLQNFYYQQRFNSSESDSAHTVKEYLENVDSKIEGYWNLDKVIHLLNIRHLLTESILKLSNGETRRLAIASALLKNPMLFLMDEPMTGLDKKTRNQFDGILRKIVDSGIQIIVATKPDQIPDVVTHVGVLQDGELVTMIREDFLNSYDIQKEKKFFHFDLDKLDKLIHIKAIQKFDSLVRMNQVTVVYGQKKILKGLDWEIKQGECWSLKGHNGAGKSTLISLIIGENPQAYANDIVLFDRKRGTGETIWGIKKHIGFVSAELSRFFPRNQTCIKVVLSGLFDTMGLFKKVTPEQEIQAMEWLALFRMTNVAGLLFNEVPLETQRFCLLARALIKSPALLVLDEATQGMDEDQSLVFLDALNHIGKHPLISMIFVSHYENEIPKIVTKEIVIQDGEVFELTDRN
ncbi:ATP-binding cassette domain-containing protein [Belliella sp. R4-6]|uniref:ATP-binding cassette domain-containing protein n=1 Tax=Belliella alkalica TaxID=1730871 RepID=A0ABS9VE51_9BACT|nr:ATP-binding cassette domain-containing protein [Belliella alkalica]MCH7414235.1 ATP-binding cassette domain-containing protein [Belliella alkalica]